MTGEYAIEGYCPEEIQFMRDTGCGESVLRVLRGCIDHEECNCSMTATSLGLSKMALKRAIDWMEKHDLITGRSTKKESAHVNISLPLETCLMVTAWDVYANPVYFRTNDIRKLLKADHRILNSHRRNNVVDCEGPLMDIIQLGKVLRMEEQVETILDEARTTKHSSGDEAIYRQASKPRDYERSTEEILQEGRPEYVCKLFAHVTLDPVTSLQLRQLSNSNERLPEHLLQKLRKALA